MSLAKVLGTVVATQKEVSIEGLKLLMLGVAGPDGELTGASVVAVDAVGAGEGEFVLFLRPHSRRPVHHVARCVFNDADAEHARFADIGDAVLGVAPVRLGRGGGEHHLRRRVGHRVEERIGREVFGAIRGPCRNPADRPWCDDRVEWVMGQAVAVCRAVEHRTYP